MQKVAMFVYNGDPMCFIHILLNSLDMVERGQTVVVVIEGSATKLVPQLEKPGNPMHRLWQEARARNLIDGVCKACAAKTGVLDGVKQSGLTLLDEMSGHPSMARYKDEGFEIISF